MHADERGAGDISFSSAFGNIPAAIPCHFASVGRAIALGKGRFT